MEKGGRENRMRGGEGDVERKEQQNYPYHNDISAHEPND